RLTDTPEEEWLSSWSPDGTQIATTIVNEESYHIEILQADGSGQQTFAVAGRSGTPVWSPDGTRIAFSSDATGSSNIWVANPDGSNAKELVTNTEFESYPAWSADGSQIFFTSWRNGTSDIYVMPVTGETEAQPAVNLTNNPALISSHPVVSPDGSKVLYAARGQYTENSGADGGITQDAGVAAILLQSVFMGAVLLLAVRRWSLPFGAVTFILTLTTLMITVLTDLYILIPGAILAGVVADLLIWRLKPHDSLNNYRWFAFVVPMVFYGFYMLTIQLIAGIGWSIHVWTGAIFLTGLISLMLSYLLTITTSTSEVVQPS
ncbi:MAG TPA: hypothetical protein VHL11_10330, partial [Phototrophicaceae bacterium]|nr:hypothetical protein [Phototrophicaceae bacterium]